MLWKELFLEKKKCLMDLSSNQVDSYPYFTVIWLYCHKDKNENNNQNNNSSQEFLVSLI